MTVEVVNKQNKLEQFKEEVRLFRKYEQAIYDLVSLYEYLLNPYDMHTQIGNTLVKKVINIFEDPEIKINYKENTDITEIVQNVFYSHYNIFYKYIGISECKEIVKCFKIRYRDEFKDIIAKKGSYKKFNLINEIFIRSSTWATQFLISDINLETRLEMFNDILNNLIEHKKYTYIIKFLNFEEYDSNMLSKVLVEKCKKELLDAFMNDKEKLRYFLEALIQNNCYNVVDSIQDKLIDFNQLYWEYKSKDCYLNGMMISTVGALCCDDEYENNNALYKFKSLYESPNYLNVDKIARYNNDILILGYLREEDLVEFIKLSNFELEDSKIYILAKRIQDKYFTKQIEDINLKYKIYNAILKKTKNDNEINYAKLFIKESRCDELNEIQDVFPRKKNDILTIFNLSRAYLQKNFNKPLIKNIKYSK